MKCQQSIATVIVTTGILLTLSWFIVLKGQKPEAYQVANALPFKFNFFKQRSVVESILRTKSCVGCDLRGIDLSGLDLSRVDLRDANLSHANLMSTKLINAILAGAQGRPTFAR